MNRTSVIIKLSEMACCLGAIATGTEWHLFGSVDRNEPSPSDIDLMIFCLNDNQADELRNAIDFDIFEIPLHISFFTYEEAKSINVVFMQNSTLIIKPD